MSAEKYFAIGRTLHRVSLIVRWSAVPNRQSEICNEE
jgi:hypothetical protein